jgi:hypothetical protein
MEELTVQERVRRAGEAYAPNVVPLGHEGFACQTGEPKRLLEVDGDHYSIDPWAKGHNFDKVSQAATDWFAQHLGASMRTG